MQRCRKDPNQMNLADRIRRDRLYKRAASVLRAAQFREFDYADAGLEWKFQRIVKNCRRIMRNNAKPGKVG